MPEQKIILSVISQALAGTDDNQLLSFIRIIHGKTTDILDKFDVVECIHIENSIE